MKTKWKRREIGIAYPAWFNRNGHKMQLQKINIARDKKELYIVGGSSALLSIKQFNRPSGRAWLIEWMLIKSITEKVNGQVVFDYDDLSAAFGLSNYSSDLGDWVIAEFGATSAQQGKYIRAKDYLNIPCAGTGQDGDPNISIELDIEIKDAIRQLLA